MFFRQKLFAIVSTILRVHIFESTVCVDIKRHRSVRHKEITVYHTNSFSFTSLNVECVTVVVMSC